MENSIQFKNCEISYKVEGQGNVLVLLHGFIESKEIWTDFSKTLSKKYTVVSIDLPGHGKSTSVNEINTMDFMAECLKAVLDELNIESIVLLGHSMGGYVATAFVRKYQKMVKGFGFFHSHALADEDNAKKNRERAIELIEQNRTNFITQFIPDLFAEINKSKYLLEIETLKESAKNMNAEAITAAMKGMKERVSGLDVLNGSKVPILFIIGKQDPRTPFEKVMAQCSLAKHCELLLLDNVGHMGYIEAKQQTIHKIDSFTDLSYSLA